MFSPKYMVKQPQKSHRLSQSIMRTGHHYFLAIAGELDLGPNWVRLVPNWTNPGLFHFGSPWQKIPLLNSVGKVSDLIQKTGQNLRLNFHNRNTTPFLFIPSSHHYFTMWMIKIIVRQKKKKNCYSWESNPRQPASDASVLPRDHQAVQY